jgi:hypothetical protein
MDNGPDVEADGGNRPPAGLEWAEFLRSCFPGRRRHDLEALKAYEAYRSESVSARSPEIVSVPAPARESLR